MKSSFELVAQNVQNGLTIRTSVDGKRQTFVAKDAADAKTLIGELVDAAFEDQPQSKPAVTTP